MRDKVAGSGPIRQEALTRVRGGEGGWRAGAGVR